MSMIYRIDKEEGITCVHWKGLVSADKLFTFICKMTSDSEWSPKGRRQIAYMRHVLADASINDRTLEDALELYMEDHDKISGVKFAIVAEHQFEKAKRFQNLISQFNSSMIIFNSMDIACNWLRIDQNEAEQIFKQLSNLDDLL